MNLWCFSFCVYLSEECYSSVMKPSKFTKSNEFFSGRICLEGASLECITTHCQRGLQKGLQCDHVIVRGEILSLALLCGMSSRGWHFLRSALHLQRDFRGSVSRNTVLPIPSSGKCHSVKLVRESKEALRKNLQIISGFFSDIPAHYVLDMMTELRIPTSGRVKFNLFPSILALSPIVSKFSATSAESQIFGLHPKNSRKLFLKR